MRILVGICTLIIPYLTSAQKLEHRLDSMLSRHIDEGKLHGCVAFVQRGDKILHFKPYGYLNVGKNIAMRKDAIFLIASMTKVITAAGALKLYEEGHFLLDEPVKKYLYQFENLKILEHIDTDSAGIVAPARDVTIRDLFRHTAGFGYAYKMNANNDTIDNLYVTNNLSRSTQTSKDFLDKICSFPLKYHPGSKWLYSYSNDILGFLIEKISGMSLHDFLTHALFNPLGMKSTGFYVNEQQIERLSCNYKYAEGKLQLINDSQTSPFTKKPTIFSGGGGLKDNVGGIVTTASDFANFCSMIMNYGKFGKRTILQSPTVELLISDQIATIEERGFPISGYGLGVGIETDQFLGRTRGVFWAGGPMNTYFKIDMEKKVIAIFLTQNSPWMHLNIMEKFGRIVDENTPSP